MSGFPNKPRILRGAFVEYGISLPPLFVVFQFNPIQLTRNRSLTHAPPSGGPDSLRDFHKISDDLAEIRDEQIVTVQEETIGFEIRLDASDKLNEGDTITEQFGISPQLSTLELMVHPKDESLIGQALGSLLGSPGGFSFTRKPNPPLVLFIWGRKRVLPVNINSLNITETLYSADLNPTQATVSVSLTVIEGRSSPYMYSKARKEAMSELNLTNITDIANVVIPG
ncbi:hypothetical protein JOY44_28645 (plasmid) [Phormidium sp. CLA17]|uniref:hypothetical protein n=1 Tax=Leptolyngbya sp. Cla-17 TaxID=2803751 RepID=UPI001932EB56|nr:hypothetical protein [Leptolyngbya sp. Cla-17]MBM0745396.1 hypothetical protein [Leptolyngbya sp. Cla-17]